MSPLAAYATAVRRDSLAFRVPRRTAWTLVAVPVAVSVLVVSTVLHRPTFEWITAEDSLLEWLQFAAFLLAGVLAASAAFRLRSHWRAASALTALFALGCLFSAGEEISWGQRLFGWGTPPALSEINHQDETTVHNITAIPIQLAFNYLQLLASLYGGVLAVVLRARWSRRPPLADLLLPPVFLAPAFLVMAVYRLLRFTVITENRFLFVKVGELPELCFALAIAGFALALFRRVQQPGEQAPELAAVATQERAEL